MKIFLRRSLPLRIKIDVSLGELVDKITILKIKKSKIADNDKLINIEKELKISFSGISKKLKQSNYCICVEKKTTNVYYIQNINSEH